MSIETHPQPSDDVLDLVLLFRRFAQHASKYEQAGLRTSSISPARIHLMCELLDLGETSMQSLAQALSIAPRSVTGLVDALEEDGMVERKPHPTDRRSTLIVLSKKGESEARLAGPMIRAHMAALFEELTTEEVSTISSGLKKAIAKMISLAGTR